MRLDVGGVAPDFRLSSVNMGEVSLGDYRGRRVLLVFGRYFGCPVCQLDFDTLVVNSEAIRRKAEIVYFTQSLFESARSYIESLGVGFPVVPVPRSDGGYLLYDAYGATGVSVGALLNLISKSREARRLGKTHGDYEGKETQSPADFVVNEEGKVIWTHRGLFDVEKVLGFLEAL